MVRVSGRRRDIRNGGFTFPGVVPVASLFRDDCVGPFYAEPSHPGGLRAATFKWVRNGTATRSRGDGGGFDTKAERATPTCFDRRYVPSATPLSTCNPGRLKR